MFTPPPQREPGRSHEGHCACVCLVSAQPVNRNPLDAGVVTSLQARSTFWSRALSLGGSGNEDITLGRAPNVISLTKGNVGGSLTA